MRYTYIACPVTTRKLWGINTMTQSEKPLPKSQSESGPIKETDAMGREIFWNDLGRLSDDGK